MDTYVNVKLLLPPRQSRGISHLIRLCAANDRHQAHWIRIPYDFHFIHRTLRHERGAGGVEFLRSQYCHLNTPGFRRQEVVQSAQTGGGVTTNLTTAEVEGTAMETDIVAQLQAKNAFLANLAVFKTSDKLAGTLLDHSA